MSRTIGYARELLTAEEANAEVAALRTAGASRVFLDRRGAANRSELERCLLTLEFGDTLLVMSATSIATSVEQFVMSVAQLRRRGIQLQCLAEPALSTAPGATSSNDDVLEALDGLRRRLIGLRTREGLNAAIAAGRKPGRPRVMTDERIEVAKELRSQKRSFAQIGRALGVSEAAVRRALISQTSAGQATNT
jgi:DNA invertase Pin-like site-specific DNA recombinase